MSKTILITGASRGIGKATAHFFHAKDCNVIATMQGTENETGLTVLDYVLVPRLAVTDGSDNLRYTTGEDAKALMSRRSVPDDAQFIGDLKTQFNLDYSDINRDKQSRFNAGINRQCEIRMH